MRVELPAEKDITGVVTGVVRQEFIRIAKICITPKSRKELMSELGLKHADHFREAYLVPSLETCMIEETIPDEPTSHLRKYRLAGKGGDFLPERSQEQEHIHARSVSLGSDILGVTAKIGLVENYGEVVTPVDYKHGKCPSCRPGLHRPYRGQYQLHGQPGAERTGYFKCQLPGVRRVPDLNWNLQQILINKSGPYFHISLSTDSKTAVAHSNSAASCALQVPARQSRSS